MAFNSLCSRLSLNSYSPPASFPKYWDYKSAMPSLVWEGERRRVEGERKPANRDACVWRSEVNFQFFGLSFQLRMELGLSCSWWGAHPELSCHGIVYGTLVEVEEEARHGGSCL